LAKDEAGKRWIVLIVVEVRKEESRGFCGDLGTIQDDGGVDKIYSMKGGTMLAPVSLELLDLARRWFEWLLWSAGIRKKPQRGCYREGTPARDNLSCRVVNMLWHCLFSTKEYFARRCQPIE